MHQFLTRFNYPRQSMTFNRLNQNQFTHSDLVSRLDDCILNLYLRQSGPSGSRQMRSSTKAPGSADGSSKHRYKLTGGIVLHAHLPDN